LVAASFGLLACMATANAQGMNGGQSPNLDNLGHPKMHATHHSMMRHSRMHHPMMIHHSMMNRHDDMR
ncbi:MAG: hypothetical protein ACRECV_11190, partial [Xanthobacteraceae bacterium]